MREPPTYTGPAPYEGAAGQPEPRERRVPAYDGPPAREGRYQPPWWVRLIGTGLIVCLVLLLLGGIVTGALAFLAYATPAASATSTQSFSVAGVPSVIVRLQAGSVSVVPGSDNQVTVTS